MEQDIIFSSPLGSPTTRKPAPSNSVVTAPPTAGKSAPSQPLGSPLSTRRKSAPPKARLKERFYKFEVIQKARALATLAARQLSTFLLALILPLLLLLLWSQCAAHEWVSPLVLPPPSVVWESFCSLYRDGTIKQNLTVSAWRIAKGFAVGGTAGLLIGTTLGASASARSYFRPTFIAISQVNVLGWIPLFILVFGIDEGLKVAIIAWSSALPVAVTTMLGIADIPNKWFELARVQELRRREVAIWIVLPATVPALFTGLRAGLGAAWISLIVVELVASSEGIGFMVVWGRQLFQLDIVMVAIVIIGAIGLALDLILRAIEQRLGRWRPATT
jgi:sulfonate transport system permease protein